jgi:hypothetical protein
MKENIEANFEFNQKNPALTDTWVQWCGSYAVLLEKDTNNDLAQFPVDTGKPVIDRIQAYCVKHGLRCSVIQNGRIML